MFVEAPEKHFVLTERDPCVASTLRATPGLVISRLGKMTKTMPIPTCYHWKSVQHIFRNWHCPAIRIRSIEFVLTQ